MSSLFAPVWGSKVADSPAKPPPSVSSITTNDGVKLVWERYGQSGPVVVLIHGWSASRHYFDRNARALAKTCQVYVYDQRFHGESDKPAWGYHIARLASDLRDLLTQLELTEVTVVGTSMGAAVIWSYIELFGEDRLAQAVFVDQAPLQNIAEDWRLGSTGCYDTASLTRLQCKLLSDFPGFAAGNVSFCASVPLPRDVAIVLESETLLADNAALARLMADHTQLDWRPVLRRIAIPCLNLVGARSAVFPPEGVEAVGKLIPNCHTVFFDAANHWLYLEEPDKFNALVADFVRDGFFGVRNKTRL